MRRPSLRMGLGAAAILVVAGLAAWTAFKAPSAEVLPGIEVSASGPVAGALRWAAFPGAVSYVVVIADAADGAMVQWAVRGDSIALGSRPGEPAIRVSPGAAYRWFVYALDAAETILATSGPQEFLCDLTCAVPPATTEPSQEPPVTEEPEPLEPTPTPLDPAVAAFIEQSCGSTTFESCDFALLDAMQEYPGALVAICEYANGGGAVMVIEEESYAEEYCSGSGTMSPYAVAAILRLP